MRLSIDEVLASLLFLGTVGILILAFTGKLVRPFKRATTGPALALWRQPEIKYFVTVVVAVGVIVAVVLACYVTYSIADESGWVPHREVVTVFIHSSEWIAGEHEACSSPASQSPFEPDTQEITSLDCGGASNEAHNLSVRFWGPDNIQKDRTWNCQRGLSLIDGLASLTCKLR